MDMSISVFTDYECGFEAIARKIENFLNGGIATWPTGILLLEIWPKGTMVLSSKDMVLVSFR